MYYVTREGTISGEIVECACVSCRWVCFQAVNINTLYFYVPLDWLTPAIPTQHLSPTPDKERVFPLLPLSPHSRSFKASGPAWGQEQRPHSLRQRIFIRKNFLLWIYKHILKDYVAQEHYFNDGSRCVIMCVFLIYSL